MNWPYIAGFFDGEGHVTFSKGRLQAGITQAGDIGYQVLGEIQVFLLGSGITSSLHKKKLVRDLKRVYTLNFSRRQVVMLLGGLVKACGIKIVLIA